MKNVISVLVIIVLGGCANSYQTYKPPSEANSKDHSSGNGYIPKALNVNFQNGKEKYIDKNETDKKNEAAAYSDHKDNLANAGSYNLESSKNSSPIVHATNTNSGTLKNTKQKGSKAGKLAEKSIPESAKNAVRALKKLEARIQAGISYRDYSPALGDAMFEVNMYNETDDAKELQDLTASINKVIQHYEYAGVMWKLKFVMQGNALDLDTSAAKEFFKSYPDANKVYEKGGVLHKMPVMVNDNLIERDKLVYDFAVAYVFSEASKELANSFALLNNKPLV
jgi:hypothetical protein